MMDSSLRDDRRKAVRLVRTLPVLPESIKSDLDQAIINDAKSALRRIIEKSSEQIDTWQHKYDNAKNKEAEKAAKAMLALWNAEQQEAEEARKTISK
jgi:hypothetical protein